MRDDLQVELDERDLAKAPLSASELRRLFAGRDPREYLNRKSPAFRARGLAGRSLTRREAIALMAEDPNLIRRPLVVAGKAMVAGFDRDRLEDELG